MKLTEYLKRHNLNQEQFGKLIDKSQQSVSNYCSGEEPARDIALKIIQVTKGEVSLYDLWDIKPKDLCIKS